MTPACGLRRGLCVAAAAILAFFATLGIAESYLHLAPPDEIRPFLGEASGLSGPYRPDPAYGIAWRDDAAFRAAYRNRLASLAPQFGPSPQKPVWAFFGNSFVQAPGMLAETVRDHVGDRFVFYLAQNTPLPIRFAEVELLLSLGLKPERIFFSIMPIDTPITGSFPLATIRVTRQGALTYAPHLPDGPAGTAVATSRLAFAAWVRGNRHRANPAFTLESSRIAIDPTLLADLMHLFARLADVASRQGVPVTVLLIPDRDQVARGASLGFQDMLAERLAALGFDVFDPRAALLGATDRSGLFIPDGHYGPAGNAVLLAALLDHLGH